MVIQNRESQQKKWEHIFRALLDVVLFLGERGLAFRGTVEKIGDTQNGIFLGILELLSKYDPLIKVFLDKVSILVKYRI